MAVSWSPLGAVSRLRVEFSLLPLPRAVCVSYPRGRGACASRPTTTPSPPGGCPCRPHRHRARPLGPSRLPPLFAGRRVGCRLRVGPFHVSLISKCPELHADADKGSPSAQRTQCLVQPTAPTAVSGGVGLGTGLTAPARRPVSVQEAGAVCLLLRTTSACQHFEWKQTLWGSLGGGCLHYHDLLGSS